MIMREKGFTELAYLFSLDSLKKERRKMIEDSLGASKPLYQALLETDNPSLRDVEFKLYELQILKRQWETAISDTNKLTEDEYCAVRRLFVKTYRNYIAGTKGTILDLDFIDTHLAGLERLVDTDKKWDETLQKFWIQLGIREKKTKDMIKDMRKAGNA